MRHPQRYLIPGLLAAAASAMSLVSAPEAVADCTPAGGAYVCAQGDVRGGGPTPPDAGPYVPYGCIDWYCGDYGLDIAIGGGGGIDGRPGRPSVGPRR